MDENNFIVAVSKLEPLCDLMHTHHDVDINTPCYAESNENAPCQASLEGQVCFLVRKMLRRKKNLKLKVATMETQLDLCIELLETSGIDNESIRRIKQENQK